jgi:chemotaxis protein CheD
MFEFLEPQPEPMREVYLSPGDFCFGDGRLRITTLLGSCVSIILWHPLLKHGGMCHYMLPTRGGHQGKPDGKYGDEAVEMFLHELQRRRTVPQEYEVRIYGGGNMFGTVPTCMDVGRRNIEIGRKLLDQHGFHVVYGHVGDFGHRKVEFDVWSGEVRLTHVSGAQEPARHG